MIDFFFIFIFIFSQCTMIESLSFEEENIITDTENLFRQKKELNYNATKYIRNFLKLEKETKANAYRY